jgi:hypothetical protein
VGHAELRGARGHTGARGAPSGSCCTWDLFSLPGRIGLIFAPLARGYPWGALVGRGVRGARGALWGSVGPREALWVSSMASHKLPTPDGSECPVKFLLRSALGAL